MILTEALGHLADIETYLMGCQHNAAPGSKAEQKFDAWRKAVNTVRAHVICEMATEDDGK